MTEQRPTQQEVRDALGRIVESAGFTGAGRLSSFLTYLVERTLSGETDRLKESVLGVEVFQRSTEYDPRTDPIVRVEARRLRSRLEEYYAGAGKPESVRIELPKGGYVPAFSKLAEVSPAIAAPVAPIAAPKPPTVEVESAPMPRGWKLVGIIAGLAVVGISLGYWQTSYMRRVRQAPLATVAVLPFANVGGEAENEYFSQGLTEEIMDRLARVKGLKVISRTVMAQFKGREAGLDEVAMRVNASMVLEGSVRRQGERLRVSARLANPKDGSSVWSQTYDRPMKDVFAVQDEIAQSIANALRVQVGPAPASASKRTTSSIEAYNAYLKGKYQANLYSRQGLQKSIEYFEECLRLDPDYAPALAGLSSTYSLLGYYNSLPADVAWPNARRTAERAIALDPTLADAHSALGLTLAFHEWKWREAEEEARRALAIDDNSAVAHGMYAAAVLLPEGRMKECRVEYRRALELDPLASFINFSYGYALLVEGRYDDAAAQYKRTLELKNIHPDMYWDLGMALGFAGRRKEAEEAMRKSLELQGLNPNRPLTGLPAYFAGDIEAARRSLPAIEAEVRAGQEDRMDLARTYSMLGEKQKALAMLAEAIQARESQVIWIKVDPRFRPLHEEARFKELLRQVGLDAAP
ncbi:tetratricopeptide repeat protein [Paludibaculum fermentans]|uniref:tetratricopeptide repeat protein n=1 Tax=Paludibaculum fermentans TaxID=1473598 RepID=UPI003EBD304E